MISPQAPWQTLVQGQLLEMFGGHIEFPEPDFRLRYLLDNFSSDLTVIEFGCWHGWHTVPLARKFRHVTAIDVRPDNVAKTLLRLHLLGIKNVDVILGNVEDHLHYKADVLVHVGVLYHLFNPVAHLHRVLPNYNILCLDTHVNKPELTPTVEICDGISYSGGLYREHGWKDPLSGVDDTSVWLDEDVLISILVRHGLEIVYEKRHVVPAGPRLNIVAVRNPILYV